MSYLRRKPEDEVWYVHSPLKKGNREVVTVPPPSQIPYLNGVFDDEATMNEPKPMYVRETDTEYIRRCKLGGSHDLLVHIDPSTRKSKEPVPYPRPLWWDAMCDYTVTLPNSHDDQRQGNPPAKTDHVFGAPEWFAHAEHRPSPDRRYNDSPKQSRQPAYTKKK